MRVLVRASVAALSVLMLFGANADNASAAPAYCGGGHECLWNNIHYVGANNLENNLFEINAYVPYFSQFSYNDGITVDRTVSSTYNYGSSSKGSFRFYLSQACGGDYFTIAPGTGDSDFTNGNPTVNGRGVNDATRSGTFPAYVGSC